MANLYDDVRTIIRQHRDLQQALENNAYALGELMQDNLRMLRAGQLRRIKRELRNFDMTTGSWKK